MSHGLELRGCAPEPLMAYLKALGIFRLVAEQKDKDARACWENDTFMLRSALDRDALVEFFLEKYKPTPIVSPWNGGSGFYPRDNQDAITDLCSSDNARLRPYRNAAAAAKVVKVMVPLIKKFQEAEKMEAPQAKKVARKEAAKARGQAKDEILAQCRASLSDGALDWLDAAYVLTTDGVKYPPLLGSGGNDGRLDFSNNFMQNVVSALNISNSGGGAATTQRRLVAALFNEGSPELMKRSTGFYNPGGVGGANASVGFNDDALTNPWDYVFMFEGALLFAGAAARRLSPQARSKAVFPFTVDGSPAGYGTSADSEYGSLTEFWAPIWSRYANLKELIHLVSEGRAQIGRRQGLTGTDFARAVAGLGTARGVSQFRRYGFLERNGQSDLAVSLGRFYTPDDKNSAERSRLSNVLFDLDLWLDILRRNASGRKPPAGLGTALRQIERAIIEFCQRGASRDLQDVLIAVGRTERWLSRSSLSKDNDKSKAKGVPPFGNLSREWISHADDGYPEFRLACAMASVLYESAQGERRVGPIRENLEPVAPDPKTRRLEWKIDSTSFVWTAGDPLVNMLAVLERRCLDGRMGGLQEEGSPPLNAAYSARLSDIAAFLSGSVDVQRVADLALPLSFVSYRRRQEREDSQRQKPLNAPFDLPAAYAVMKLTLLPGRFVCPEIGVDGEGIDIAMEPSMLAMLRAGRVGAAYRVAYRRLRASGLRPLSGDPGIRDGSEQGRRLAAALLFPLDESAYKALAERALRKPDKFENE